MANCTLAPDSDYDVFVNDSPDARETEPCDHYDTKVLSAQLVPQLYTAVLLVGLLGNGLLVLVLVKRKGLRHVETIYFLNLAVANLGFLLALPFWVHSALHGGLLADPACKIVAALSSVGLNGEVLFSVLLTGFVRERSFCSSARKVSCATVTSVMTWAAAILVASPELLVYESQTGSQEHTCFLSRLHLLPGDKTSWKYFLTLRMNMVGFLVPLLAFIVCYVRMRKAPRSRGETCAIRELVSAIMVVFLLMWGPYSTALFLATFKDYISLHDCTSSYALDRSIQVTRIIATTHCCVNPLLHVLLNRTCRRHLCCLGRLCGTAPHPSAEHSAQDASSCAEHNPTTEV